MHLLRLLALLVVLAALSVGAIQAQDETVLVIGHAEATDSLDPARGYNQTTGIINQVTYDTLVTFPSDSAASIEPRLAESWTVSDDGLTYTFTLREGVVFADGDPLTAADVVFSFNRLKNIKGNPSSLTANIASVEAPDDATVVVTLVAPSPAFLAVMTNSAFGVVDSEVVMENGGTDAEDADTTDTAEEYLNGTSAGSGPYVLESWEPQVETVLVRNENYWGEQAYFDRIIISNITEAATQKVALESGEIDIALDLTSDQMADLEGNADIAIFNGSGNIVHFLLMNMNEEVGGPMSDPQVQEAVRLALDYEGYKALWGGITPASPMAFGIATAYGEDHAVVRDVAAAQALMDEAGYGDGFEVTLDYPIFTFQGVNMDTNAQKIQADLAEIGITVTLNPMELQVGLEGYRAGTQGFAYWFWGPDVLDPTDTLNFVPGGTVAGRAQWMEEGADADLLALRDEGRLETDPDARTEVFQQIQDYLQHNGPFAAFIQPGVQTAFRADLEGYVWHPQWLVDLSLLSRAE
jgi:peptide/nickel transport system substrate-binding protein